MLYAIIALVGISVGYVVGYALTKESDRNAKLESLEREIELLNKHEASLKNALSVIEKQEAIIKRLSAGAKTE